MIAPVLVLSLLAAEGPRVALLVSDDIGIGDELPLRSTGSDAARLAAVLEELGGFDPADVHRLAGKTAGEVLDAVDALTRGPTASLFFFYYSGHADAGALHPAGTLLPIDLLLYRLRAVPAELRVGVLDACQSGSATKGSRPAAPFEVRLDQHDSAGEILISSSAADEQSFEGEHGGLFTLHLTAGLRGAADGNGDARVTVSEAYEYAYAQTLRSTLAASTGPQHPRFRYELAGRRDPLLTQLGRGALLALRTDTEGDYVVFDASERSVVAEVPGRPGEARRIALAPGAYLVRLRDLRSLRVARIRLAEGDDRVLWSHQMQEVPLLRLARKGALGERWAVASVGSYYSGLGPRGILAGSLGLEWERGSWLWLGGLELTRGTERHRELETQDTIAGATLGALYSLRLSRSALRVGPTLGAGAVWQTPAGGATATAAAVSAGLRIRLDLQLTEQVMVFAGADLRLLGARVDDSGGGVGARFGGLGLFPTAAYALGARLAF